MSVPAQNISRGAEIGAVVRLSPEAASVGEARRFVDSTLASWGETEVADVVVLLTSELVTNVVLHAGPHAGGEEMALALAWAEGVIRVEVRDHASRLPVARPPSDVPGGRGLVLLDALASAWGATPGQCGKVVWFEVSA